MRDLEKEIAKTRPYVETLLEQGGLLCGSAPLWRGALPSFWLSLHAANPSWWLGGSGQLRLQTTNNHNNADIPIQTTFYTPSSSYKRDSGLGSDSHFASFPPITFRNPSCHYTVRLAQSS